MAGRNTLAGAWDDLRELLALSFPIIVAMASHTLMGFVDTWILARYGPNELAAVGAADAVAFTLLAFIFGTGNCVSTFVSQSMGRGEPAECARYTWQGIYFGIAMQVLILPFIISPRPTAWLMGLFGHKPVLRDLEGVYLQIRMFHIVSSAGYAALTSFFQGIGRPRVPMVAALVANVFNAVLDYVLVFGLLGFPEMGIAGAALATTLSSFFQTGLLLALFFAPRMQERFNTRRVWRFDASRLKRLLRVGLPAGVSFGLDIASWAIFTNVLIGTLGRDVLAASNIARQIIGLSFMPAIGIHKGVTVLVARYVGRGDIRGAKRRTYVALAVTMAYMGFMGLCFVLFRGHMIRWFRDDPAIVAAGRNILIFAAIFQVFDAVGIVCVGALRGAGDTRFPAVVAISLSWGLMVPLGYALTFTAKLGYVGAWAAAAIYIAVYGGVMFWRFTSEAWRKIDIFE